MTRLEVMRFLEACGWKKDRFGHYHKEMMTHTAEGNVMAPHRFKMLERSTRFERKITIADRPDWFTIARSYYGEIEILPGNRIKIGRLVVEAM